MSWAYEGVECYVSLNQEGNHVPLYRAWNQGDHFYTTSKEEYDGLAGNYQREGISCYVSTVKGHGHVPLYRLYSSKADDHFYCISAAERDEAVSKHGYALEGIVGYVLRREGMGHVPFYRAWNPEIGDHFYTTNVREIDDNGPSLTPGNLREIIQTQLKGHLGNVQMFFADGRYFCPTERVSSDIIHSSHVDQRRYIAEIHDCDDFAHLLKSAFIEDAYDGGRRSMPYALGIVWGSKPAHAMNMLVLGDGKDFHVQIVEPQTGTIHQPSEDKLNEIYLIVI